MKNTNRILNSATGKNASVVESQVSERIQDAGLKLWF